MTYSLILVFLFGNFVKSYSELGFKGSIFVSTFVLIMMVPLIEGLMWIVKKSNEWLKKHYKKENKKIYDLFPKIDNEKNALKAIDNAFGGAVTIALINVGIGFLNSRTKFMNLLPLDFYLEALLLFLIGSLIYIFKNRITASFGLIYSSFTFCITFLNVFGITRAGGGNLLLAALLFIYMLNAYKAGNFLSKKKIKVKKITPTFWILLVIFVIASTLLTFYSINSLKNIKEHIGKLGSSSMEHPVSFNAWWATQEKEYSKYNITKSNFLAFPFNQGMEKGTILIYEKVPYNELKIGDVVLFEAKNETWVSRIIGKYYDVEDDYEYVNMKMDKNSVSLPQELWVDPIDIKGKVTDIYGN